MLEALGERGAARFYRWGRVLVANYTEQTRLDELELWAELQRAARGGAGGAERFATLSFVTSASIRSDDGVRDLARRMSAEFQDVSIANALVVPERSLSAAAFRSILTGITLASRSRVPQAVFRTAAEAAAWLSEQGGLPQEDVGAFAQALAREISTQPATPG